MCLKKLLDKENVRNNDVILAVPSSGLHSNGYSLVRSILKKNKISKKLKIELLKPTKIYTKEIVKLNKKNLIHSAAHITGGGLIENLSRSVPKNFVINLDLSKIKVKNIFRWLKRNNVSDKEMLRTFNCGIGFCIIAKKTILITLKKTLKKNISLMK